MKITIDDIEVHVKLANKGTTLATATIVVDGIFEIHGWTISTSKYIHRYFSEKIQIQPPRVRINPIMWKRTVFVKNPALWKDLEEKIYNQYRWVKIEFGKNGTLPLPDKSKDADDKVQ